jgi:hypothetical protein
MKDAARIEIWQGDLTELAVDAIVNAASSSLLATKIMTEAMAAFRTARASESLA